MFLHGTLYQTCLRRLHDRRGADAAALPAADRIDRPSAADPLGAVRLQRLRRAARHFDRQRLFQMVDRQLRPAVAGRDARRDFARARRCCSSSSACSSRCFATGSTTPRSSSADPRISPLITLGVAAIFAGTADGLKQIIYNYYGNTNSEGPIIFAAALSTVLVNPIQERVQRWSEQQVPEEPVPASRRFARGRARHARDRFAGRNARRSPGADRARRARGAQRGDRRRPGRSRPATWRSTRSRTGARSTRAIPSDLCESSDRLFPLRVPLVPSSDDEEPIGYLLVGPRPDGSIPSKDEQKALAGVSEAIARAIRTVIKREAREEKVAELIDVEPRGGSRSSKRCSAPARRWPASVARAPPEPRRRLISP